ncbi:MAG TPA: anti-sigma factor [Actinomycetes bacterium]|jgi:anti-sigma factor (TIGR02949 family)|nr:anti-sigma factor [Actinomycetes bacterium]
MRTDDELACRDVVEAVTDYLEGAMPAADRERFERHLAGCDDCAAYLEQLRTSIRLSGRVQAESMPPALREGLLRAFRDWRRS